MKVICKQCSKEFDKFPANVKKSLNHFCTRSCAATFNNSKYPKRKRKQSQFKIVYCSNCNVKIDKRSTRCKRCSYIKRGNRIDNLSIAEAKYSNGQTANRYTRIRDRAKTLYKDLALECEVCSYAMHVEICHIKPISLFSEGSLVKEVNDRSNIKFLCPNHHWELDHTPLDH